MIDPGGNDRFQQNLPSPQVARNGSKDPLRLIPRPPIDAPNGHERMSEVGKRITTAECRLVGRRGGAVHDQNATFAHGGANVAF